MEYKTNNAVSLVLAYKNFAANKNISHIGLGVAALNTAKYLRAHGISTVVWPIVNAKELTDKLSKGSYTHVVVSAPWIGVADYQRITQEFNEIEFACNCHSNVGFLGADTNGVKLIRAYLGVALGSLNFRVATNSLRAMRWLDGVYEQDSKRVVYLPNLYMLDNPDINRPLFTGGKLRIGAFGATRPLKNLPNAVAAALQIARDMRVDLEITLSSGRAEGGGHGVLESVRAMCTGLTRVKLLESGWQSWPDFRQVVRAQDLLLQPSYTESFNMVTADGIAEGVPSVVSEAIDWVPEHWKAPVDDAIEIARVGRSLLTDRYAGEDGVEALERHNASGLRAWRSWLKV